VKWVFALLLSVSLACAADDDHDPAAELASFQVAEGFQVNLFASEAHGVIKPIQMRFDAQGRLWVVGSTVYPQLEPGQTPNDKVLVLEDRDHDGHCDRVTVFADGLMIPTGIELTRDGAYIGHGTELLLLRDTDGDLKADKREVVFRGFGTGDNHQNINSFNWGPAGELWMCQGLHIHSNVETLFGIVRLHKAGIWRFWPNRLKLEGFYGSEHEPQNPWGFVFTDWGEPIELAGNNSSPIYPVPGLVTPHHDIPPTLIWKNGNGRKCSGGEIVGTAHFPDSWQGALILGGYLNNAVWTLKIFDDGAGFRLEDLPPLIKSSSRSFRPVDVRFGPDGALYICDWYNPIIGHYQASFRHPDRDKKHGRIWRVTAKGRSLTPVPELTRASASELVGHLTSPDCWTRYFAKRTLADRPREQVVPALRSFTQTTASELALKEVLGVYQSHEVVESDLLARLTHAKEPGARAYAASVVGLWADRLGDPLTLLRPLVADEQPRVRLQALIACTHVLRAEAMELAANITDSPTDRFLDYGWQQAVYALKPYWLPALRSNELSLGNKPSRLRALALADGTSDTRDALRQSLDSAPAGSRVALMQVLAEVGDESDFLRLLRMQPDAPVLAAIRSASALRKLKPKTSTAALLTPLVASKNGDVQAEALRLVGTWKVEDFKAQVAQMATDSATAEAVCRAAIDALVDFGDRKVIEQLLSDSRIGVRSAAIAALCRFDLQEAAIHAAEVFKSVRDRAALSEVFAAFLQRKDGPATLAKVLSAKPVSARAAEAGLEVMNSSGRRHEELARILQTAAGKTLREQLSPGELSGFVAEVRTRGDAKRGMAIFRRPELGCLACHNVNGEGGTSGPSLSALGTAQPIDFIVGAILEPQKEIKEGFTSVSITTRDGNEFQGYVQRESPDEVLIRDLLQNKEVRLARSAITEKRPNGSIMPTGLVDTLTREEFRDLVSYLAGLGQNR
jgi:putative heme-binding domain-containing protein